MKEIANSTFTFLTDISYDYGLITKKVYGQRIAALYELNGLEPNGYYFFGNSETDLPFDDNNDIEIGKDYIEINKEEMGLTDALQINKELYSKDNVLHLITEQQGKYCRWKFNEYDADDKPSIPHGHGIERKNIKLDPYRSLIYDINKGFSKAVSKEEESFIKYLWNNSDFRNLATLAIKHHIDNLNKHPLYWLNYRGLTHSPKRLPRPRR